MKLYLVFVVFVAICKVETFSRNFNQLQKAFVKITKVLTQRKSLVSVVYGDSGSERSKSAIAETTSGILHVVIEYKKNSKSFRLNSSAIVSLDSIESLKTFNDRTTLTATFSTRHRLFIYCQNGTVDDISTLSKHQKIPIMQYEYFVVQEEKSIRLLTFVWFNPKKCNMPQIVEVNKFDKRWQHGIFEIDKFSNFHGCRINFLIHSSTPEFYHYQVDHKRRTITSCRGYVCAMVIDFSSVLNYTLHMNFRIHKKVMWPDIPHVLHLESVDLTTKFSGDPKNKFEVSKLVTHIEHFITVPPGETYNAYEKMVLPFDEDTWMWIGITFASAFCTIFALKFTQHDIANFIMGRNTKTPVLNVLRAFFGISQISCPGRNFARYLLMLFILFSLVVRTAYQGKMFEFLHKDMRKPTVTTIEEMIENNFTFYMRNGFKQSNVESDLAKRGNVNESYTLNELYTVFDRVYFPGSKEVSFYMKEMYYKVIYGVLKRFDPPKLLEKPYVIEKRVLKFPRFHFLFEIFDRKLHHYIEGGLVDFNIRDFENEITNPKIFEIFQKPHAILTLVALEAGFVVCMVPLVLSVLAFVIEWMLTLKDLLVILFIFKKYFDFKKLEQLKHRELVKVRMELRPEAIRKK